MSDDPAFQALMDESTTLIDAVDALPDEFWAEYCNRPYEYGEYNNLTGEEWYAIQIYLTHNDWGPINKIIADINHDQTASFRQFLIDRPKRPSRGKKAKYSPVFIYNL